MCYAKKLSIHIFIVYRVNSQGHIRVVLTHCPNWNTQCCSQCTSMVSGCSLIILLHSQLFSLMLATTLMFDPPHTSDHCVKTVYSYPPHYISEGLVNSLCSECWPLSHVTNNNSIQDRALAEVVNQAIPKCSRQDKYNWQSVCSRCIHITQSQLTLHHVPI